MKRSIIIALALAPALAACSDDAVGPTGDQLSREEAAFIAAEVLANGEMSMDVPEGFVGDVQVDKVPFTAARDLVITHSCPAGGQVTLRWSADIDLDPDAGDLTIDVEGSQEHDACGFTRQAITYVINGDPGISVTAHVEIENHQPVGEHTLNVEGGFRWSSSDDRSGTCPINVEAITNFATRTRTVEGSVCGHTISETFTWT